MTSSAKARMRRSKWGYARLQRGDILCVRLDKDKVVLVELNGGWMFLPNSQIVAIPSPALPDIVAALTGIELSVLERLESLCEEPAVLQQVLKELSIESFSLWQLKNMGIIVKQGKIQNRDAYIWDGYDWDIADSIIQELANRPSRQTNDYA